MAWIISLSLLTVRKIKKVFKRKKKTKNETNNADKDETPLHQHLEPKQPTDVEKSKIASFQANEVNSATSKETGLVKKHIS